MLLAELGALVALSNLWCLDLHPSFRWQEPSAKQTVIHCTRQSDSRPTEDAGLEDEHLIHW